MIRLTIVVAFTALVFGAKIPCEGDWKEEYIVGGKPTNIEEVPYQVALLIGNRFVCGGSILTPTHVLTAAHCVSSYSIGKVSLNIRAGSSREISGGVVVPVKNHTYHPKFSMQTIDYDVAVLKLSSPLKFNQTIKPITLGDEEPADGELVLASGWGCLKENGVRPIQLQSVQVPMVNRKLCENNYKKYMKITARMICAGVEGKDSCQGDSGGPLVYKGKLIGIVSTGVGCARRDFPGIYTNVADPDVTAFIKHNTKI